MKKITPLLIFVFPFTLMFCTTSVSKENKMMHVEKNANQKKGIAVLELFTSQGCSSCPPADRLLGKLASKENVIALSFHVDYWDRLGWKDPFSNAAFSQRQRDYAELFGKDNIYTPQLIVNGEKEAIGSEENKISGLIKNAQAHEEALNININKVNVNDTAATISFTIEGNKDKSILNIALIETEVTTAVKAGENDGRELTSYNVVRSFKTIPAEEGANTASINLIPGADKKEYNIVAYLQNPQTHKIYAAVKFAL